MAMDRESEIGALWVRQGRDGEFWSGKVGDQEVVVFRNRFKQPGERSPDLRIFKSAPRDGQQQAAKPQPQRGSIADELDDGIPF